MVDMRLSCSTARIALLSLLLVAGSISAREQTLVVLGDSLSAAHGMDMAQGWVHLLRDRLEQSVGQTRVINASVSGETTSGGLARLPGLLERHRPDWLILELGGNDGLRGLPLPQMHANLLRMVRLARDADARVLLVGMKLPPNYGPVYTRSFETVYREIARQTGAPLVPFLLEGVAGSDRLMQPDNIHAAPEAQAQLLTNVWAVLEPLITPGPGETGHNGSS